MEELEGTGAVQPEEKKLRETHAHPWKGVRSRESRFTLKGSRGQSGRVDTLDLF